MKRFLALFLSILLLSAVFCACGDNKQPAKESETEAEDKFLKIDNLPAVTFNDADFRIMDRGEAYNDAQAEDVWAEKTDGTVINDAVFTRNTLIQSQYGVKIVEMPIDKDPALTLREWINGGATNYPNLIVDEVLDMTTISQENCLYNLYSSDVLKYTDLENDWWDQNFAAGLSIGDKLYYINGEINISDNWGSWGMSFNKDIVKEFNLTSPYELVDTGKWTYDVMYEMMETVSGLEHGDVDGNGEMSPSDRWGLVTEQFNTYAFYVGSGERIIGKDENNYPVNTFCTERAFDALVKTGKIQGAKNITNTHGNNKVEEESRLIFYKGNCLFLASFMRNIEDMRAYDINFGIIPMPKLDETQKDYYSAITPYHFCVYGIPSCNKPEDLEMIDVIFEAMGAYSQKYLTPAYYEKMICGIVLRDEESIPMFDIIFSHIRFDLGLLYNYGGIYDRILTIQNETKGSRMASIADSLGAAIQGDLDKLIYKLQEEENN